MQNPEPCFQLLELLKNDKAKYVQKSIANHLNDHSKKHPEKVVEILSRWQKSKNQGHGMDHQTHCGL
ncbi:MAG: DNA alkylation repair protein [Saprospiraceae bacterium]